jgi:hypothetical protein
MATFTQQYPTGKGQLYFTADIVGGTEKAHKLNVGGKTIWLPKAAVKQDGDAYIVARWFKYNDYQLSAIEPVSGFVVI